MTNSRLESAATIACVAATLFLPAAALATPFTQTNGQYVVTPGYYTTQALLSVNGTPVVVVNQGTFAVPLLPNAIQVQTGATTVSGRGGSLDFTTTAPIALVPPSPTSGSVGAYYAAVDLTSSGGPGSTNDAPSASGASGTINVSVIDTTVSASVTDTTVSTQTAPTNQSGLLAGLYLATRSQAGGTSTHKNQAGAFANYADAITTTVTGSTISATSTNSASGGAIVGFQTGGQGGNGYESSTAGQGGTTALQTATVTNSTLMTSGANLSGLLFRQRGGAGGNGHDTSPLSNGGVGGDTLGAEIIFQNGTGNVVTTDGAMAPAVRIDQAAGNGGMGSTDNGISANGGNGGAGGSVRYTSFASASAAVVSTGPLTIGTHGAASPGIQITSQAGTGGASASLSNVGGNQSGDGGAGGGAGGVTVMLGAGASIATRGDTSAAISVSLISGSGGAAGSSVGTVAGTSGNGGNSGYGGTVFVSVAADDLLSTKGAQSPGIFAQAVGGRGGNTQRASGVVYTSGGNGGIGGDSGVITVDTAAAITTEGVGSRGVFAQGHSGEGGQGANSDGVTDSNSGSGGKAGAVGKISVTNSGTIVTRGAGAQGILAQSLGGSGGDAGSSYGALFTSSGDGGTAATSGGEINVTSTGAITTSGAVAAGVVAQSIGGGGGDAGPSSSVIYGSGGAGGLGGNGGDVTVTLSGAITTAGQLSQGVVVQSIGGGGGTGGNATTASAGVTVALGGSAGDGGDGGKAEFDGHSLSITTSGAAAHGIVAQSIGRGGGTGGGATGTSVSLGFSVAVAVGGSGKGGGAGGAVTVNLGDTTIRTGLGADQFTADAIGLIAHSVGGGGGAGGGANALAVAVSLPSPPEGTPSVAAAAAVSLGGSGAMGSNGGAVTVNLGTGMDATTSGAVSIVTGGAGSHGMLVESTGGGGGQGGDSTSLAATIGSNGLYSGTAAKFTGTPSASDSLSVTVAASVGGVAGGGGAGGPVTVRLSSPGSPVTVATTGDYAYGMNIQSLGGGGGNAGTGSATTNYEGKAKNVSVTGSLGHAGGTGGDGGVVQVNLAQGTTVSTLGSSALGVLVQSTGGGGGTATGSTITSTLYTNLSEFAAKPGAEIPTDHPIAKQQGLKINGSFSLGSTGGAGGNGGAVTVVNSGRITTNGNDSPALAVQSIGGGGGVGGSAGNDASVSGDEAATGGTVVDNSRGQNALKLVNLAGKDAFAGFIALVAGIEQDVTFSLSLGGRGGSAGNGAAVNVTHGGTIVTSGDYSPGIFVQSIGGGGGRGGTGLGGGEGNSFASIAGTGLVSSNVSLGAGGGGGTGGSGGNVVVTLDGGAQIMTGVGKGLGFQSIGILAQSVGGGGGTGADGTLKPSGFLSLGAGLAGGGGASGNGAAVSLLQGAAGAPSVIATLGEAAHGVVLQSIGAGGGLGGAGSTTSLGVSDQAVSVNISLGSGAGSSGNGGDIYVTQPQLQITTAGRNAVGLLAQSIGGGGGLVNVTGSSPTVTSLGGGSGSANGIMQIILPGSSSIMTSGIGAHGLVAQSIGGGGGMIAGSVFNPAATPVVTNDASVLPPTKTAGSGFGGPVQVTTSGSIATTGAGAFGILAQSVGNGGGIAALANGQTFIGSSSPAGSGLGGSVTVEAVGTVTATGENAVGIYAQSVGRSNGSAGGVVTVKTSGLVQGGSGAQGAAIVVDGGQTLRNLITVDATSSLSALSGTAIRVTGAATNVINNGTITGSTLLDGGSISGSGGAVPTFMNNGTLALTSTPTVVQATLVQTGMGQITTTADFATGQAGVLTVLGNAQLGGTLRTSLRSVQSNVRVPVLTVTGTASGTLTPASTALFDFALLPTPTAGGTRYDLVASGSHFGDPRFALTPGRRAVASGLESAYAAGSPALAGFFADLDNAAAANPGEYARRLAQLGPRAAATVSARRASDAAQIANASMSCPVFAGTSSFLTEGPCIYGRATSRTSSDGGDADRGGLQLDSAVFQVGGQAELQPGLYLGGSLAYETSWLDAKADGVKGRGAAGQGAATLKWQTGPWLLTGAAFGSVGSFDINRTVSLPNVTAVGKGTTDMQSGGLRARVAYTIGADPLYIRPYLNVDGLYARSGSYREAGLGIYGLTYGTSSQTTAVFNPALELGGRVNMGSSVLRAYVSAGAAIRTSDTWKVSARLQGAAPGASGFTVSVPQDRATARIGTGVQLFFGERLDLRAQYEGDFGDRTTSHGGSLTLAWRL